MSAACQGEVVLRDAQQRSAGRVAGEVPGAAVLRQRAGIGRFSGRVVEGDDGVIVGVERKLRGAGGSVGTDNHRVPVGVAVGVHDLAGLGIAKTNLGLGAEVFGAVVEIQINRGGGMFATVIAYSVLLPSSVAKGILAFGGSGGTLVVRRREGEKLLVCTGAGNAHGEAAESQSDFVQTFRGLDASAISAVSTR